MRRFGQLDELAGTGGFLASDAASSVTGAAFHGPLGILTRQEAVDQAGSKRIASAHAIKNFKIFAIFCLVELAVAIADRAPIVLGSSLGFPQRCRNRL